MPNTFAIATIDEIFINEDYLTLPVNHIFIKDQHFQFIFEDEKYTVETTKYRESFDAVSKGITWFYSLVNDNDMFIFTPALTREHVNTKVLPLYCWQNEETGVYHFETNFIKIS